MNPHRVGRWRTGGVQVNAVYRVSKKDLGRVGNCWMKGRLLVGDLVMPLEHAGDCFYTYQLLEGGNTRGETTVNVKGEHSYRICEGVTFGAYAMGTLIAEQPNIREYHLLMVGQPTSFSERIDVKKVMAESQAEVERELEQNITNAVAQMKADFDQHKH
jgi:hypothetical protein